MANPNPAHKIRSTKEAQIIGRKGGINSGKTRQAQKEVLDVFKGARDLTTQKDLDEAFKTIQRFAKRGSLPHWQEWLRLIGQTEQEKPEEESATGIILMPKREQN